MILSLQEMERLSDGKHSVEPGHCHYPPVHNGGKISSDVLLCNKQPDIARLMLFKNNFLVLLVQSFDAILNKKGP